MRSLIEAKMEAESIPAMQEVESSNVHSIGYDYTKGNLYVRFWKDSTTRRSQVSGNVYKYFDVPFNVFYMMTKMASKGKFVWRELRDKYRYKMIGRKGWRKRPPKRPAKKKAPSKRRG